METTPRINVILIWC